jgi:signal transduction histidine kinase
MTKFSTSEQEVLDYISKKRNILFSQITLCATVVAFYHALIDWLDGMQAASIIDLLLGFLVLSAFWLNKTGRHNTGKTLLLFLLNLGFAAYASVLPSQVGVYLFYLPLMSISAAIFDSKDKLLGYGFIGLSILMLFLLFFFDFKLLGSLSIESYDEEDSYIINLFSSSVLFVLCILFTIKLNETSEKRLHDLAREVQIKNEGLEKANVELDRFLYSTSHDLRAPLMSIKGLVNLAQRKESDIPFYLNLINQQTDKLDGFIQEIIDYSKNARMELRPELLDIKNAAQDVTAHLKYIDGADKIQFQYDVQFSDKVVTDRSRIQMILSNLISNSIKYHNLVQEAPHIAITACRNNGHWKLSVADNGKGIPREHQNKVFDMFYRADESSKGSGLGLYIVKEAVCKLNGKIELQSEPNKGTTFTVTLPWN